MKKSRLHYFFANPFNISIFLLFVLAFISFDVKMGNDEGIWSYIGRIWETNGIPPYSGSVENKTPLIFELFRISYAFFGVNTYFVRGLGIFSIIISSLIVYLIGRNLSNYLSGILSMYLFGLTMTWELLDGSYLSQTETFMVLFSSLSFYLLIKAKDNLKSIAFVFLAGFSLGIAIAFKQIAITTAMASFLFFLIYTSENKNKQYKIIGIFLFSLGICCSTLLSLLHLFLSGVLLTEYIDGAWFILLNSGSSAPSMKAHFSSFFRIWQDSRIVIFYPFLCLLFVQINLIRKKYFVGLLLWLLFDFIGVNSSGNYYGHQLKQLMPALSITIGILISNLLPTINHKLNLSDSKYISRMTIFAIILLLFPYDIILKKLYNLNSVPSIDINKKTGVWLRDNTRSGDYIYMIGVDNSILSYSERISSSKYFNSIFITTDTERETLLTDLKNKPPVFIIKDKNIKNIKDILGDKVDDYINSNYNSIQNKYNYDILKINY